MLELLRAGREHAGLLISGGSLRGRIASLDAPLAGALIVGAHVSAIADSEGRFWLPGVPLGVVEVLVSAAGHVSRRCARCMYCLSSGFSLTTASA